MKQCVVLLRSGDESDPYEQALEKHGFDVVSVPVLSFRMVNAERLREALEHPDEFGGMILTSPRAVDALGEMMPWLPSENMRWHSLPFYVVGPRTASMLRDLGFDSQGEGSGTAEMLAEHIIIHRPEKPLLFLCGDRRRDVLPIALERAGVQVTELVVYESSLRRIVDWPTNRDVDWIVFFSPSGLEAVQNDRDVSIAGARIACIGPTTADALESAGIAVSAIADEPSPDSVALAIRRSGRGR